ncbi:DEAD/DEAH box helicase [Anaerostipes hadrus]|uniref:DEAD/DEAH box helicase n=1 Tax=Anaerostipes hadrus TaxID=649756 RepID=UPI0021091435|nr:DEAD/DEAH box helicase [Anaerostipes hadrus]MCQ5015090.1 DEAD/DEAH box helicase [Anaerostipes hadrus]
MDKTIKIILEIQNAKSICFNRGFEILLYCTQLLSQHSEEAESDARKICIHVLDNWEKFDKNLSKIWADLIETLGFYPYIQKNSSDLKIMSFADDVRMSYFRSEFLQDTYLHKEQKKISNFLIQGKNVVASAPTSFGKSLLIEEIIASKKYKNIVIIQPTLALLDETRMKLRKYKDDYKIVVRTSQRYSENKRNLFLLTAERVMEYEPLPKIDFLIIDEFYKLSLKRNDERADILNNAFLKIVNNFHSKFYFLGPNIDGITSGFAEKYNAIFYKSDFSLVDCNVIDKSNSIDWNNSNKKIDQDKCKLLCSLLDKLQNEQTLIYCLTPARARRMAKIYLEHLQNIERKKGRKLPLVEWIDKNISSEWSLSKELQYGIAVHDGSLQKHIGTSIIKYFNAGNLNCIFCTSTIIEGVNTSAKNVILFDEKKGSKYIDFFDYSNIKGRSGRMMEHYVGRIFNFCHIPKQESVIIDIPFYEQNPKTITDEILINIEKEDVKCEVRDRYDMVTAIPKNLLYIIKKNGVSIAGQIRIYNELLKTIEVDKNLKNIQWSQLPTWNQMEYILKLAENNLFDFQHKRGVFSVRQLTRFLNMYTRKKNIMDIVEDIFDSKNKNVKKLTKERKQKNFDEAIETAFHIYRHWFQFTIPKVFRVVDSLQRLICERANIKPGSYSFFVQQLENDFIRDNLSILVEFGVPSNTVRRLENIIPENISEDEVVEFIKKNQNDIKRNLLIYERECLEQCL